MTGASTIDHNHPRWSLLTPGQRNHIANGCGRKGGWLSPPSFLFRASCDQHDFYYWRGGTEADRREADLAFYRAMMRDAARSGWWLRWFHYSLARAYYEAVRQWGADAFYYRTSPATWEDLEEEMRRVT